MPVNRGRPVPGHPYLSVVACKLSQNTMKATINVLMVLVTLMFLLFAGCEENVAKAFVFVLLAFLCVVLMYIINFEKEFRK